MDRNRLTDRQRLAVLTMDALAARAAAAARPVKEHRARMAAAAASPVPIPRAVRRD